MISYSATMIIWWCGKIGLCYQGSQTILISDDTQIFRKFEECHSLDLSGTQQFRQPMLKPWFDIHNASLFPPNWRTSSTNGEFKYGPAIILFQSEARLVPKDCSSGWGSPKTHHPTAHACMLDRSWRLMLDCNLPPTQLQPDLLLSPSTGSQNY